jgi:glucosamine kinase
VRDGLWVGVDAGGSSTVALASNGRSARAGPANPSTQGVHAAVTAIAKAVAEAAGDGARVAALYVGAAGAGRASVASAMEAGLRSLLPDASVVVEHDAGIALRAAIPEGPGAVLIAGTGSLAYAENGPLVARVGGAGYLLGDEGSAFAIGFAAVRLLARAFDGREPLEETARLAGRALGADSRDDLLGRVYGRAQEGELDVARIASLAPSIIAFAGKGNRAARQIVERAARDLADLAAAAVRQAELASGSARLALAGGLLREPSLLTSLLASALARALPDCAIVPWAVGREPERAALRLAHALVVSTASA